MVDVERVLEPHSSSLLKQINRVVEWEPDKSLPASKNILIGRFDIGDLAKAIGLNTEETMSQLFESIANHERIGPFSIWKKETKNEISLKLGRGLSLEYIVLHFPFEDRWFPSVVDANGMVLDTLRCHEDANGSHWTVRGLYTPDISVAKTHPHGFYMTYDWSRAQKNLALVAITPHQFGESKPDAVIRYESNPKLGYVMLDGIGTFSVPGRLSEEDFFRNLVFPLQSPQFDVRRHILRRWTVDNVFGAKHIPLHASGDI